MANSTLAMHSKSAEIHDNHNVTVQYEPTGSRQVARLRCLDCNTHLKWLSQSQAQEICRVLGDPEH